MWEHVTDTPKYDSTCATIRGQLLAIGGHDSLNSHEKSKAVYRYDQNTLNWNFVGGMNTAPQGMLRGCSGHH